MKKYYPRIIKIVLAVLALFVVGIVGMYLYVSRHKKEMLAYVQDSFNDSYNGTLSIKDVEPDLWKNFPSVSIALRDVIIRDTLWAQHKIDFLNVKNVYLKLKFWPLLLGNVKLSKLIVSDGSLTVFELENYMVNKGIFEKENKKPKKKSKFEIREFELENFHFKFTHFHNKKHFEFHIPNIIGRVDFKGGLTQIRANGKIVVKQFVFNTEKGSYFRDKEIKMNSVFLYNIAKSTLSLDHQIFSIDDSKLTLTGDFYLAKEDNKFAINIESDKIVYKNGLSWVPPTVRRTLDSFQFGRPINMVMHIEGKLKDQRIPYVTIKSNFVNNELDSKFGKFDSLSFNMVYLNGSLKSNLYGDEYSFLKITQMKGQYFGIPFSADTTTVFNLKLSKIKTHLLANFPIQKLNNVFGKRSFQFGKGTANIDISYEGGMKKEANYPSIISAKIDIKKAELSYLPRQLKFNNCDVFLQIKDNDIQVVESTLHTQKSHLKVVALARNFIGLYRTNPGEIIIDATVKSDKIDLNEFQSFIRKRGAPKQSKQAPDNSPDVLDEALDVSKTNLNIAVKSLVYKRFEANNINAQITLLQDGIDLHRVSLLHSNGVINMSGNFVGSNSNRPAFAIAADVKQASIDKLLYSFDNFGQQSFLPENIRGTIDINTQLSGNFNADGQMVPRSLKGTTSFEIKKGALIDFKPLQRIGRLIFRKDRLKNVQFEKIKNTISIVGNKIDIPPMWVNTDLVDMQIQGVYRLDTGTNLLIEIPLFKFTKEDIAEDPELSGSKGFRLYVQGKDDENGNLKFSLKLKNSEIGAARVERRRIKDAKKLRKKMK